MKLTDKTERARLRLRKFRKIRNITLFLLVSGLLLYGVIHFYYPYGEGVKSGQLNYVVYKGIIFKTYEGKLIQSGIRSQDGGIQSNEFEFSVADEVIAKKLMLAGGQVVELHYREYFGAILWRGYSRYIVDSIVSMSSSGNDINHAPPVVIPSEEL
ncbi:MAG: hypothetical protein LBH90_06810 [Tannerella sp.]|jgi:hypothetical protein|nr:hypothetical protein [Tannerella sp.]